MTISDYPIQSETIDQILPVLIQVQSNIEGISKDAVNPFFKSKYATLSSVLDVAKEILNKNNILIIQSPHILIYGPVLITTLYHDSGQWMRSYTPIFLTKNDSQGLGGAITYLRRYSLTAMLGISEYDDDGNGACKKKDYRDNEDKPMPNNISHDEQLKKFKRDYQIDTDSDYDKYIKHLCTVTQKTKDEMIDFACSNQDRFDDAYLKWKNTK